MSGLPATLEDHFLHPRGRGRARAGAVRGNANNPVCGDLLEIEIVSNGDWIEEAKFMAQACSSVIAVASLTMERLQGAPLADARSLNIDFLVKSAGGLHPTRSHAIATVERALRDAFDKIS